MSLLPPVQRNSGPETSERCLTEEEASKGFEDMVRGMGEADETAKCDFTKFDVDGSDLDAKMTCSGPAFATGARFGPARLAQLPPAAVSAARLPASSTRTERAFRPRALTRRST